MNLLIDRKFSYDFVLEIKKKLVREVLIKLSINNFTKIDVEINKLFQPPEVLLSKQIILYELDNLFIVKISNYYYIEINLYIKYIKININ